MKKEKPADTKRTVIAPLGDAMEAQLNDAPTKAKKKPSSGHESENSKTCPRPQNR